MNITKFKRATLTFFFLTLIAVLAIGSLVVCNVIFFWNINIWDHLAEFWSRVIHTFNVTLWLDTSYSLILSLGITIVLICILMAIVGWCVWIIKTKRYVDIVYIILLVLLTALNLHYVLFFESDYYSLIGSLDIFAILITAIYVIGFFAMILLTINALLLDYYRPQSVIPFKEDETEEIRQIVFSTDTVVIKEESIDSVIVIKEPKEEIIVIDETPREVIEEAIREEVPIINKTESGEFVGITGTTKRALPPPFALRLRRGTDELRNMYNDIKAEFLSYGLKSRVSLTGDTFKSRNKTYAIIQVIGKSLKVFYALDPKDYVSSPIPHEDVSRQKKYVEVPFLVKTRSDLSIRRAKELIKDAVALEGITQVSEPVQKNYAREAIETLKDSPYYLKNFARKA